MMYEQDANQKAHPLTMAGNRHYAKARDTNNDHDTRAIDATLAVAFEQRTANLLELLNYTTDPEKFNPLLRTIEARLGL